MSEETANITIAGIFILLIMVMIFIIPIGIKTI